MSAFLKKIIIAIITWEARAVLRKYQPKVVAITGSVGKTATKDAVYAVLAKGHHVRRSEKSFNSEIGIPLTILGVPNAWSNPLRWLTNIFDGLFLLFSSARYPEWLVLEVGADRPGDIKQVASWLSVDIAVITRLPEMPVHVEFFDSPDAVVEEKAQLIKALKPEGTLVLYGDDKKTAALASRFTGRVLRFGFEEGEVRGEHVKLLFEGGSSAEAGWPVGMELSLKVGDATAPVSVLGSIGSHALLPLLAGAAVGHALGKGMGEIVEALHNYDAPKGRMRLIPGLKDTLVIDDTYNSSPAAVEAALETLALIKPTGRRVAVLGDMAELGRHSISEHRKLGAEVAKVADLLVAVGFRGRGIAEGALDAGMSDSKILQYEDASRAGDELDDILEAGDCILVKGSQSMRMERVVEEIMREPERAAELLVRQEEEWKKR